jgi:hypothetical protein
MAKTLYRFFFYEVGERIPVEAAVTRCKSPALLARRYMRFVNHAWCKPGGYDKVLARADVHQVGIWPSGDKFVRTVRA